MLRETRAEIAAKELAISAYGVSRETMERLDVYNQHLRHWQKTINLVSPSTLPDLWSRHILDSLQIFALEPQARSWVDLGSGGGFPGLVIACMLAETGGTIDLIESNRKKAAFLRHVTQGLGLPARIHAERIERVLPQSEPYDVITARALAPLTELIGYSRDLLKSGAVALFPKGREYEVELTEAGHRWHFCYELHTSRTEPEARIIRITALS